MWLFFQPEPWPLCGRPRSERGSRGDGPRGAWSGHPAPRGTGGIRREEGQPWIHNRKCAPWGMRFAPEKPSQATDRVTAARSTFSGFTWHRVSLRPARIHIWIIDYRSRRAQATASLSRRQKAREQSPSRLLTTSHRAFSDTEPFFIVRLSGTGAEQYLRAIPWRCRGRRRRAGGRDGPGSERD